jgi:hypothetical protein
MEIKKRH